MVDGVSDFDNVISERQNEWFVNWLLTIHNSNKDL